jgi:two-component system, cell cycle sensor histidine kinase and response regulator CckA
VSACGMAADLERNANGAQSGGDGYYKYLFDHLSVCMFFVDVTPDGRFRYAGFNPAEEKAIGLSSQHVMGKFVEEVFDPDLARKLVENYRRCLEAGTPISYNDELNLPDGCRHFVSNLIPFRNREGRIHRIVGACIDTTDLKRTQEEAISRHKLESLGLIAAGIAHDFQNFLASIIAYTELAETEVDEGSSPKEKLLTIRTVATSATELVRELMAYAGQDSTIREFTDLSHLVQEVLQLIKMFVSKDATLRVTLPQEAAVVYANSAQLRQVLMNLVTNASEALGDRGGVISISVARMIESEAIDRLSTNQSKWVRLTISDTGAGMTPEVLSKIFDPFFTTKSSGRGLGLAAVQGIIRSHGGLVNVTSVPGKGADFEILLPCVTAAEAARTATA